MNGYVNEEFTNHQVQTKGITTTRCCNHNDEDDERQVLAGYWFEWLTDPEWGASVHTWPQEIPYEYNMIVVAFMINRPDGIPTFAPDPKFLGEQGFIDAMVKFRNEGRDVLISLGGAVGHYQLRMDQKEAFKSEVRRVFNQYGFTGFDLNLENTSIMAGDNQRVLPQALNELKAEFAAKGRRFIITMSPEFPYLRVGGFNGVTYGEYLNNTNYDYIFPQYYNQGGDGPFGPSFQLIGNNNVARREDFIYYLTRALVNGQDESGTPFYQIPPEKLSPGFPSAPNAAYGNGVFYTDPAIIERAWNRLRANGIPIGGIMTWSINQDKQDLGLGPFDFGRRVGAMLDTAGNNPPPPPLPPIVDPEPPITSEPEIPGTGNIIAPTNLRITGKTENTISLAWYGANGNGYQVFRNGVLIETLPAGSTSFMDTSLVKGATYTYSVRTLITSAISNAATGTTSSNIVIPPIPPTEVAEWNDSATYQIGDIVTYQGQTYRALQAHTANPWWA